MIGNILTLFIFVVMSDCTVDNQGILFHISSGENVCNNDKLFRNFKFSDIPEFGAMCNIPIPNETQVEFLVENNVIPILCMGVYDVSLRLCNEAVNDTFYFKDFFPPSSEQFSGIFNTLKQTKEYSDLNKFCSETIKKHNKIESSSNNTKLWWEVFSNEINDSERCKSICRTNEINQVHPLCSYIAWSNDMVHNHQNNLDESEAKNLEVPVDSLTDKNVVLSDLTKKLEKDHVLHDKYDSEIEKSLTSGLKTADPVPAGFIIPRPPQPESLNLGPNSTKQATEVGPDKSNVPIIVAEEKLTSAPTIEAAKSSVNITLDIYNNNSALINGPENIKTKLTTNNSALIKHPENTETKLSKNNSALIKHPENTETKLTKKVEEKENEKVISNFPGEEIKLNSAGSAVPVDSKTDVKNKDQTKEVEIDADDQNDFNGEFNFDNVPSDQPIGSDPETQQQMEEELEDDDEATVVENPEKATPKSGTSLNKKEPHNNQGKPDEVYSEVDRTILLQDPFIEAEDTHFFSYFLFMSVLTIAAYLAFHNKNKLLALAVEGRRTKSSRRRPNSSNYSKLDCSLEEAMVSNTTASVTHVLY